MEIFYKFHVCKRSILIHRIFSYPDTKEELEILHTSPHALHFVFIRHIMYRTLIIEIAKLYSGSKNDKYRLSHFINSFKKTGNFENLKLSERVIAEWEKMITDNNNIINDVILIRDKIYAHPDFKQDEFERIDLSFAKLSKLIEVAENIFKQVYSLLLNTDLLTTSPIREIQLPFML